MSKYISNFRVTLYLRLLIFVTITVFALSITILMNKSRKMSLKHGSKGKYDRGSAITEALRVFLAAGVKTSSRYRLQWLAIKNSTPADGMYRLNHKNACVGKSNPFLLILVKSAVHNFKKRQTWRDHWGAVRSAHGKKIRVFYLTAMTTNKRSLHDLDNENERFGDILQMGTFLDAYVNLTYKVLSAFEWAISFCPSAPYVLSVDDDVLVIPSRLLKYLSTNDDDDLFGGYNFIPGMRSTEKGHKWFVNFSDYPMIYYPEYAAGFAMILSGRLIPKLLNASASLPFMFHIDDAYLGVCALSLGIKPKSITGFELYPLQKKVRYIYKKYKSVIAVHGLKESEKISMWRQLQLDQNLYHEKEWQPS